VGFTNGGRVGVALSSGGAASLAQIGALEVLLEAGVPIDVVAGTSAGAIIGAVLCSGRLAAFRDAFMNFTWRQTLGFFRLVWPRGALLEFHSALEFTSRYVAERIEDLDKPYAAVAADLVTGDEVIIRSGNVIDALRASCAIPGIFPPRRKEGRWLADGALVNPIPVSIARDLGARFTIAIHVLLANESHTERFTRLCRIPTRRSVREQIALQLRRFRGTMDLADVPDADAVDPSAPAGLRFFAVLMQATRIVQCQIAAARMQREPADAIVHIPVGDIGTFDFHRASELVEAGRKAARGALPDIVRVLEPTPTTRLFRRFVERLQPAAIA
jgi:NTE family protein